LPASSAGCKTPPYDDLYAQLIEIEIDYDYAHEHEF